MEIHFCSSHPHPNMVHIWVLQLIACPLNKLLTVIYLFFLSWNTVKHSQKVNECKAEN